MTDQDRFYSKYESDFFFDRWLKKKQKINKIRPQCKETVKFLSSNINLKNNSVLEIGCFIGDKLNYLNKKYNCKIFGLEPSLKACKYAKKNYQIYIENNTLINSSLNNFSSNKGKFDLIILDDVMNWFDRDHMMHSLALIDHLVSNTGYIFIKDYFPNFTYSNKNHHWPNEDIRSYKYQHGYSSLFTKFGTYSLIHSQITSKNELLLKGNLKNDHSISEDTILQKNLINNFPIVVY